MPIKSLDRRTFLRASGVALGLPLLDAMQPTFAAPDRDASRRIVAINTNLGILSEHFYPESTGRDYTLTPYLETLADFRDQFTVISGCSHPDVTGGHSAEVSFLTAAPHPGTASFRNSISLDQFAVPIAERDSTKLLRDNQTREMRSNWVTSFPKSLRPSSWRALR